MRELAKQGSKGFGTRSTVNTAQIFGSLEIFHCVNGICVVIAINRQRSEARDTVEPCLNDILNVAGSDANFRALLFCCWLKNAIHNQSRIISGIHGGLNLADRSGISRTAAGGRSPMRGNLPGGHRIRIQQNTSPFWYQHGQTRP